MRGDGAQLRNHIFKAHRMEAEVLAARTDGLRNIFGSGGRHHEDHVAGRLFQRLQQRVEGGIGYLVGFVKDVDLVAVARRTIAGGIAQLANLVDAAIGGRVNLDHVDRVTGTNFGARFADAAGFGDRMIGRTAIQRHRQNARHRGFPNAAMPAKNVAVSHAVLLNGIFQRASDMLLPDHVGEALRTVFAGQDRVAHARSSQLAVHSLQCAERGVHSFGAEFHV